MYLLTNQKLRTVTHENREGWRRSGGISLIRRTHKHPGPALRLQTDRPVQPGVGVGHGLR